MSPADARQLLDDMARKYDENFDGKFNYPGTLPLDVINYTIPHHIIFAKYRNSIKGPTLVAAPFD